MTRLAAASALFSFAAVAALASLSGGCDPHAANDGQVYLSAWDSDECSDLHCPMALGTRSDIILRARSASIVQKDMVLTSSDTSVIQVQRGVLADDLQSWSITSSKEGWADLVVRDPSGREMGRASVEVVPVAHATLAYAFAIASQSDVDKIKGPEAEPGYAEKWHIPTGAGVTFEITPRSAAGDALMGFFDYSFDTDASTMTDPTGGLPFLGVTATSPGEHVVRIHTTQASGPDIRVLFLAE